MALLTVVDQLITSFDDEQLIGIFLDFPQAFVKRRYGIRDNALT